MGARPPGEQRISISSFSFERQLPILGVGICLTTHSNIFTVYTLQNAFQLPRCTSLDLPVYFAPRGNIKCCQSPALLWSFSNWVAPSARPQSLKLNSARCSFTAAHHTIESCRSQEFSSQIRPLQTWCFSLKSCL